jgi:glycosidase
MHMVTRKLGFFCSLLLLLLGGCATPAPHQQSSVETATGNAMRTNLAAPDARYRPQPYVKIQHPAWSKKAAIYQINLRQFSPEGTLAAAQTQLPRLKTLGVDILWLMPIHPIGVRNRKGSLGSPYSVKDYFEVNPEFGSKQDLKNFVDAAHAQGMHVILDWVANHTAWDNPLLQAHPDWYKRDHQGNPHPSAWWDWSDIIELDYRSPGLREYMTGALKYWVQEFGIDGYRADVAGFVPLDFWNNARAELDAIKPVFMLAEWESRDLHAQAFDTSYAWSWWDSVHKICTNKADVFALHTYYSWNENFYPPDAQRMTFVSNHDKNAWEGTEFENFSDGLHAAMVLSVVGEGMPLIYNGQEAGYNKRLAFFERDPIQWREHENGALYQKLLALKHSNAALWNAPWGARMIHVPNSAEKAVLSFVRMNETDKVFAVFNFSAAAQTVSFDNDLALGSYRDFADAKALQITAKTNMQLPAWSYRVLLGSNPR